MGAGRAGGGVSNSTQKQAADLDRLAAEWAQQSVEARGTLHRLVYYQDVLKANDPQHYAQHIDEVWEGARRVLAQPTPEPTYLSALLDLARAALFYERARSEAPNDAPRIFLARDAYLEALRVVGEKESA